MQARLKQVSRLGCNRITPCWSPLVFWNIHWNWKKKFSQNWKKKFSYELTEIFFQWPLKFFFSSRLRTENKFQWALYKKIHLVYNWNFFSVWNECKNGYFKKSVEINRGIGYLASLESKMRWCLFIFKIVQK